MLDMSLAKEVPAPLSKEEKIVSALGCIGCDDREVWLDVCMALKSESESYFSIFDTWSSRSSKYLGSEDCRKTWDSCKRSGITIATLFNLAQQNGWTIPTVNASYYTAQWDEVIDSINNDKDDYTKESYQELINYLSVMFADDDHVAYQTNANFIPEKNKWTPGDGWGVFKLTKKKIVETILDIGTSKLENAIAGETDLNPEAGAWIRINPMDGKGIRDNNVTEFKHVLVECDNLPREEQIRLYKELNLPIRALVDSAGKSIHAIVKIDAGNDPQLYKERVNFLFTILRRKGLTLDEQNKNASRLSRMAGVMRNGHRQRLIDVNIGARDWDNWVLFINGEKTIEELLTPVNTNEWTIHNRPQKAPELISGILRKGHKMMLCGPSKSGKSFALINLGLCLSLGKKWLNHQCVKSNVYYFNFEIDNNSFINRCLDVVHSIDETQTTIPDNFKIINCRGANKNVEDLAQALPSMPYIDKMDVIIFDPIYKIQNGDENAAKDITCFTNFLDKIATKCNASIIYVHHHAKGKADQKEVIDRSSGSGVYGRDVDALIDFCGIDFVIKDGDPRQKEKLDWMKENDYPDFYECSFVLREFKSPKPYHIYFKYPTHCIDVNDITNDNLTFEQKEKLRIKKMEEKRTEFGSSLKRAISDLQCDGISITQSIVAEKMRLSKGRLSQLLKKHEFDFKDFLK